MSDALELSGRRALVTGGTKGIGAAVAAQLRASGATVLTTAPSRHGDPASEDLFVAADVTTAAECATVVDAARDRLRGIDVIVHVVLAQVAPATPRSAGCEECLRAGDKWIHLRLCLTCGHVGCCDASAQQHATRHFRASGHPIVQSLATEET